MHNKLVADRSFISLILFIHDVFYLVLYLKVAYTKIFYIASA